VSFGLIEYQKADCWKVWDVMRTYKPHYIPSVHQITQGVLDKAASFQLVAESIERDPAQASRFLELRTAIVQDISDNTAM
jgi:hypothetical protein